MKLISLTQGKVALVDDVDYDWLNQWKWHAQKSRDTFYAVRYSPVQNGTWIRMHRQIMGLAKGDPREVDHNDHNGLNNQRINLRTATTSQNQHNRKKQKGTSRFKGVCWFRQTDKWRAQIKVNTKKIGLGYFLCDVTAAKAYDKAARMYFGEFAHTNFKELK